MKKPATKSKNPWLTGGVSDSEDDASARKPLSRQRARNVDKISPIKQFRREDSYTDPKILAEMTKSLLAKIYKGSHERYEKDTSKLENKGEVFHLAANLDYRKSLVHVSPQFAKDFVSYERKVTQKLDKVDQNELKYRKTFSITEIIEEGDKDVYNNCTAEEILNPIGTLPKDGFKGEK